jgi:hypothetical protein
MNPYVIPCVCSVCGGEGLGHAGYGAAEWLYDAVHKDPRVCLDNLRARRRREEALGRLGLQVADGEGI